MGKIESKVADTILQKPMEVVVAGETYEVAPPSIATLILVSKEISKLPRYKMKDNNLMEDVLSIAKDCKPIGDIAAILILGAKKCRLPQNRLLKLFHRGNNKNELARKLLEEMTVREVQNLIAQLLQQMQLGDFFGLTTFLLEVNLIRPTKVD